MKSLGKRREFDLVFQQGQRARDEFFALHVVCGPQAEIRLGMVVSRKVGKAVRRNRLRRIIREVIRAHKANIADGAHIVVVARRGARGLLQGPGAFSRAEISLVELMRQLGIYGREDGLCGGF